jgi:hypothetical protein
LAAVRGGRWWRKGWEDEYDERNVYTCMQMQKLYLLKVFQDLGEVG